MSRVRRVQAVAGSPARAEALWSDANRWPGWVESFDRVVRREGQWPEAGSCVVWDSTPHGRGRVVERMLARDAGRAQDVQVSDDRLEGRQHTSFHDEGTGCEIAVELEYRLKGRGGPLLAVVDLLFIRRALGDSLRRQLAAFAREVHAGGG